MLSSSQEFVSLSIVVSFLFYTWLVYNKSSDHNFGKKSPNVSNRHSRLLRSSEAKNKLEKVVSSRHTLYRQIIPQWMPFAFSAICSFPPGHTMSKGVHRWYSIKISAVMFSCAMLPSLRGIIADPIWMQSTIAKRYGMFWYFVVDHSVYRIQSIIATIYSIIYMCAVYSIKLEKGLGSPPAISTHLM